MADSSTIVLITGANSGVGYATVQVLASTSERYHIILAGRSAQKVQDAAASIASTTTLQGSISTLILDVTDEDSIAQAVETTKQKFGRVDVLINNAGIGSQDPNLKKELETTLLTNAIGPVLVTEAFKPLVLASKHPIVIHVSSGLGSLGLNADRNHPMRTVSYTVYRMSKSALNMYMIENEKELGQKGVKVFGVCPGLVRSNLRGTSEDQISAGGKAEDPEKSGRLILDIIEGRRDEDVGKVVNFNGTYDW